MACLDKSNPAINRASEYLGDVIVSKTLDKVTNKNDINDIFRSISEFGPYSQNYIWLHRKTKEDSLNQLLSEVDRMSDKYGLLKSVVTTTIIRWQENNNSIELPTKKEFLKELYNTPEYLHPEIENIIRNGDEPFITPKDVIDTANNQNKSLITELSNKLGVNYRIITTKEAKELDINWNGEKGFFYKDTVYLIGDKIDNNTVIHEFSHPIINSIIKTNPDLAANLTISLRETKEGNSLEKKIQELYPELEVDSPRYIGELLTHALTEAYQNQESSKEFKNWIQKLFYNIKQHLRSIFGRKIDISKLNSNTTLDKLAVMLSKGNKFDLKSETKLTEEDVANFVKDYDNLSKDLEKFGEDDLRFITNEIYSRVKEQMSVIKRLAERGDVSQLNSILIEGKGGQLGEIIRLLGDFQNISSYISSDDQIDYLNKAFENLDRDKQQISAVVRSIEQIFNLSANIHNDMERILKNLDDPENIELLFSYTKLVDSWRNMLLGTTGILPKLKESLDISEHNSFIGKLEAIKNILNVIDELNKKASSKIAKDAVWNTLKFYADDIDKRYRTELAKFYKFNSSNDKELFIELGTNNGALKTKQGTEEYRLFKEKEKEYLNRRLTPERIENALNGRIGDSKVFESWLLPIINSTDPIIGSVGMMIQSATNRSRISAKHDIDLFLMEINPLLEKIGLKTTKYKKLFEKLITTEIDYVFDNETGELKEQKVYNIINKFRDHLGALQKMRIDIDIATQKANETGDRTELIKLKREYLEHKEKFFHTEKPQELIDAESQFRSDIAMEAQEELDAVVIKLRSLNNIDIQSMTFDEKLTLENKYRQEYKLLFSFRDIDGNIKTDPTEIAKVKSRIEKRDATSKFFKPILIKNRFENELLKYEEYLTDAKNLKPGDDEFDKLRRAWIDHNTVSVPTDNYWEIVNDLYEQLGVILDKYSNEGSKDIKELRQKLNDMLSLVRDDNREINVGLLTDSQIKLIFSLEDELDELILQSKRDESKPKMELTDYYAMKNIFEKLNKIQKKSPTSYMIDTINSKLISISNKILVETIGDNEITFENFNDFVKAYLKDNKLSGIDPELDTWMHENFKLTINNDYVPRAIWIKSLPIQDKHKFKYVFINSKGDQEIIYGKLKGKFYRHELVNPTKKVIDKTVDVFGNWLPKTVEEGAPDGRYIDERFKRLRDEDPVAYKLANILLRFHLNQQADVHVSKRLNTRLARFRAKGDEIVSNFNLSGLLTNIKDGIASSGDQYGDGLNNNDRITLATFDTFDDGLAVPPVRGTWYIDHETVSKDVIGSTIRYVLSLHENRELMKINPAIKAISNTIDNKPLANDTYDRHAFNIHKILKKTISKGDYTRKQIINAIYDKTYKGENITGMGSKSAVLNNIVNKILGFSRFFYFAFNLISSIKNRANMLFNNNIEAFGGEDFDQLSLRIGSVRSFKVISSVLLSGRLHSSLPKNLDEQLLEIMEPVPGLYTNYSIEGITTNTARQLLRGKGPMTGRRIMEIEGSLKMFYAMLHSTKVDVVINGKVKKIPYLDAWEIKDGHITLREGVDPEWGPNGIKFDRFINKVQDKSIKLYGVISSNQMPLANRYLLFRLFVSIRSFFAPMFDNHFGGHIYYDKTETGFLRKLKIESKYSYAKQNFHMGHWLRMIKIIRDTLVYYKHAWPYLNKQDRIAFIKVISELGLTLLIMYIPMLLGYDDDDDKALQKLKSWSGPPIPKSLSSEPNRDFHTGGWLRQESVLMLLKLNMENTQFIPLPGLGLKNLSSIKDNTSLVFTPTIDNYIDITKDLTFILTGNPREYKRTVGPYKWQDKEHDKIWNRFGKMIALQGSSIDPYYGVKNSRAWDPVRR